VSAPTAVDPAERGRLDIHPTVLRKIVEYTADRTPGTLRRARTVAGVDLGSSGATAKVTVGGDGTAVDVRLELSLRYPDPVRATVAAVRARVAEELERLAGRHVRTLSITVSDLRPG
jgi:uncharacterized alkaline shock family protein YloU